MNCQLLGKTSIVLVITCSMLQTGCITAKKMDKYVSTQYGDNIMLKKIKSDYLTISSPLITDDALPSASSMKTKKVLPLILYWRMDYRTNCILNPKIPINQFSTSLATYANSKGLKKKLNGAMLELTINKLPLSFSFNDDFSFLILVGWEKVYLLPENNEMALSYKIINSGSKVKEGTITVADPNQIKGTRYFQSVRNATREYLTQYDENMKTMAKSVVDQLLSEL